MAVYRPKLNMTAGQTYTFDVSHTSNATHPFRFTSDSGSTEYTTGVIVNGTHGQAGATVSFTPNADGPSVLHYYCTAHGLGMGNKIEVSGLNVFQKQYTMANANAYGTPANDTFGQHVAVSSTHFIVGAYQEDDNSGAPGEPYPGAGSGKAYIYNNSNGNLLYTLDNPNQYSTSSFDHFGSSVGLSSQYAVVGAYRDQITSQYKPGSAYIFNLSDGTKKHTLVNPSANSNTYLNVEQKFGHAADINNTYALVSAIGQAGGKAYVFNTSNGSLAYTLNNPNAYGTDAGDEFGKSVSMSDTYAIIGAPSEDDAGGNQSGKAYVYTISPSFSQTYTLNNPNPDNSAASDMFGISVGVSNTHAIVSSTYEDDSDGTNDDGKAYIYDLSDGSLLHTLNNPGTGTQFGYTVDIDSNYAVVSSIYENNSGAAYVFKVSDGSLVQTISNPSGQGSSYFGYGASIGGGKIGVGAPYYDDSAGNASAGIAYLYSSS